MTQKHTQEPWGLDDELGHTAFILDANGSAFASMGAIDSSPNGVANARRIVACVNAMAGIGDDSALLFPGNSVRSVISGMKLKQMELEQQRDELLAALEDFIKYADDCDNDSPELARARSAIAKTTGETK